MFTSPRSDRRAWRIIGLALAFGLAAAPPPIQAAGAGPAAAAGATSTTILIALGEDNLPPFQFTGENGQPTGILVDLWRLWARRTGVQLEIRPMRWADALVRFREGEGDLIVGIIKTPERESWLDFTAPYFISRLEVFVKKDETGAVRLADLKGRRIGAVQDDYGHVYLTGRLPPGATLSAYPDLSAMIQAAGDGRIDAFLGYHTVVNYYLAQHQQLTAFKSLPRPCQTLEVHAAVRKGDARLLALLNRGLALITQDERDAITMQWNAEPFPGAVLWGSLLGIVIGLAAIGVALGSLFRRRMARRMAGLMSGLDEQQREKERAVASMRFNEQRLEAFTETLSGILFILDYEGTYIDIFGSEDQLLAAPRSQLLGRTVEEMLPPDAARPIMNAVRAAIQSRTMHVVEYALEAPAGRRVFEGRASFIPESPADRPMVVFLALDVTEQKQLGEQLRQAQKMEAIGRLAGGVAHDFNNILTAIIGFAELAADDLHDPDLARQHLREIGDGADRASGLTRQLLAFSRRQTLTPKPLNLNDVVGRIEKMLRRLIGDDIVLKTDLAPDLEMTLADPSQIDQVLLNLAVNARDAMPQGGQLTLSTRNLDLTDQTFGPTATLHPGFYVVLEVADTGVGIDDATRVRLFEPFFTTKDRDKGTGLGLSTVYGIVKQSGGDIVCISQPGQGATFRIYLPCSPEDAAAAIPLAAPAGAESDGHGTLMVVEDNDVVRSLIRRVLEAKGYQVLEATDATQALAVFEQRGATVQLLICDVVMPGMNGPELVRRLAPRYPRLRVLFISGYTDGEAVTPETTMAGAQFLLKPFHPEDLLARVQRALEAPVNVSAGN